MCAWLVPDITGKNRWSRCVVLTYLPVFMQEVTCYCVLRCRFDVLSVWFLWTVFQTRWHDEICWLKYLYSREDLLTYLHD